MTVFRVMVVQPGKVFLCRLMVRQVIWFHWKLLFQLSRRSVPLRRVFLPIRRGRSLFAVPSRRVKLNYVDRLLLLVLFGRIRRPVSRTRWGMILIRVRCCFRVILKIKWCRPRVRKLGLPT